MRIAALVMTALLASAGAAFAEDWRVSASGYGPVTIGMTVEEASTLLGTQLTNTPGLYDAAPDCDYYSGDASSPGIAFMTSFGRVVRVDVFDRGVKTAAGGLAVGHDIAEVRGVFPDAEVTLLRGNRSYVTAWSKDRRSAIRFEGKDGKIARYYAGRAPAVEYVEGCL